MSVIIDTLVHLLPSTDRLYHMFLGTILVFGSWNWHRAWLRARRGDLLLAHAHELILHRVDLCLDTVFAMRHSGHTSTDTNKRDWDCLHSNLTELLGMSRTLRESFMTSVLRLLIERVQTVRDAEVSDFSVPPGVEENLASLAIWMQCMYTPMHPQVDGLDRSNLIQLASFFQRLRDNPSAYQTMVAMFQKDPAATKELDRLLRTY